MEWRLAGLMECLQGKLHNTGSITREGEDEEGGERKRRGGGRQYVAYNNLDTHKAKYHACGCISPSLSHAH